MKKSKSNLYAEWTLSVYVIDSDTMKHKQYFNAVTGQDRENLNYLLYCSEVQSMLMPQIVTHPHRSLVKSAITGALWWCSG